MKLHHALILIPACFILLQGCVVKQLANSKPGDTLAQSGSVYASDNDIELVGEVLPFFLINLIAVLLITFVPALSVGVVHWFNS